MVRISKIKQFSEFLGTFPGNFSTIRRCYQIFESFGWMESAQCFPRRSLRTTYYWENLDRAVVLVIESKVL